MNLITYRFTLDLAKHGSQVILSGMKVGDTNRAIDVALTVNGEPFYLGAEHAAQIRAHVFTDQGEFQFTNACQIKNTRVFYIVDPAILSAAGDVQADLEIGTVGKEIFSTAKFVFFVTGTVSDDGDIPGDQYESVNTALATAQTAVKRSISAVEKDNGDLVIRLLDGTEYDVGNIIGPKGDRGPKGERGPQGEQGPQGEKGADAVYYKYDFNGDGEVNEDDVLRLLYYVNFSQAPEYRPSWWSDPDVNGDGVIGSEDATTLQNWLETGNEAAYAIAPKNELVDDHFSATSEKPIRNKAVSAGAANALKGTASGTVVSITDVSPLEHEIGVKLSSDTVTDFSSVTLTKQGKNLLDISQMTTENEASSIYGDFHKNEDGSYTFIKDGDGANGWQSKVLPLNIKANTKVYLSADILRMDESFYLMAKYANGGQKGVNFNSSSAFIPTDDVTSCFFYTAQANANGTTLIAKNIQLEYGETATEYEPYKEPETVSVKQDGTASIIGKGEGITLMTDTEGVTITAEYNRDVNKALADLEAKLQALILEV